MAQIVTFKNATGSSCDQPSSGSWIELWKQRTGVSSPVCAVMFCSRPGVLGGHVVPHPEDMIAPKGTCIVPLCAEHNNQRGGVFLCRPDYFNAHFVPVGLLRQGTLSFSYSQTLLDILRKRRAA